MSGDGKKAKKAAYFQRLYNYLDTYTRILVVCVDNVGSKQIQDIRIALRGRAEVLMGKNTMVRRALRGIIAKRPELQGFMNLVKGNVGFVFTNDTPRDIRDVIQENKVKAPARAGALAQCDVFVEPVQTALEPTMTSFFQALSIPTKITRGTIEILSRVHLIVEGEKVGSSEATLLQKLDIMPFHYGLITTHVYDEGSVYAAAILDISDEDMAMKFQAGIQNVACISLAVSYPSLAAFPHMILNGYKNLVAIALETEYTFSQCEAIKEIITNPEAFAAAQAAAAASAPAASSGGDAAPAAAAKEESESDDDMGFGLFD